jgi:predicted Zn-dependent protease
MDDTIDKAIQVCLKKLKLNPQDWNARTFLGRCYLKKGMLQEARKEFEEVVKTVSDNKVIFKLLADIYEKEGRTKEAKWIYRNRRACQKRGNKRCKRGKTHKDYTRSKRACYKRKNSKKRKETKGKEKDIYNDDSRYLFKTGLYG